MAGPTLIDATAAYIKSKGKADSLKFTKLTEIAIGTIIKQSGNKLISAYTRADAIRFRDSLFERDISQTQSISNQKYLELCCAWIWHRQIKPVCAHEHQPCNWACKTAIDTSSLYKDSPKTVQTYEWWYLLATCPNIGYRHEVIWSNRAYKWGCRLDAQIPSISLTERPWRPLASVNASRRNVIE